MWKPLINERTITLESLDDAKVRIHVVFRLYNTGLGIRYLVPEQKSVDTITVTKDATEFAFTEDGYGMESWPGSKTGSLQTTSFPISSFQTQTGHIPVTVNMKDNSYVSIAHADNREQEPMYVTNNAPFYSAGNTTLTVNNHCATAEKSFVSAWNAIIVADDADELVNSHLIQSLNPACEFEGDLTWLKGGNSTWDWRNHGAVYDEDGTEFMYTLNTASFDRYIDFAAEQPGVRGVMIDDFWYQGRMTGSESDPTAVDNGAPDPVKAGTIDLDMDVLSQKCADKDVDLWIYVNDVDLIGYETDIPDFFGEENMKNVEARVDRILDQYKEWGAVGIKLGFVMAANPGSNTNYDITAGPNYMRFLCEELAERHMMLDMHEAVQPFGMERTYPNFVGVEYIEAQYDRPFNDDLTATQLCLVPFSNNLIAPLDRAQGQFDMTTVRKKANKQIYTTIANQLGQLINIYAGVVSLPDSPNGYMMHPDMFEFINAMPAGDGVDGPRAGDWDETRVLYAVVRTGFTATADKVGVAIARRAGDTWFIGCMNSEGAKTIELDMSFLGEGEYTAKVYGDGPDASGFSNRDDYKIYTETVDNTSKLPITMAVGGGAGIVVSPVC